MHGLILGPGSRISQMSHHGPRAGLLDAVPFGPVASAAMLGAVQEAADIDRDP